MRVGGDATGLVGLFAAAGSVMYITRRYPNEIEALWLITEIVSWRRFSFVGLLYRNAGHLPRLRKVSL